MRPYSLPPIIIGTVAIVANPFQSVQALSSTEVSTIAEAITVRIEGQNPGSGVLIKRQGDTYTILTAAHVVATEDEYEIVTADETIYSLDYRRVQKFAGVDLALVEFSSSKSYQVADLGDSGTVKSGSPVYVSGFPEPTAAITERIWNFSPGVVTANARRPLADGYALVYTNNTLPGMSGGAVLDERGKLVGIHGRADTDEQAQVTESIRVKTGFNLAIPINTFTSLVAQVNPALGFVRATNPVSSGELTADDWFLTAGEKYEKGDFRGAIADLDKVIQLKPDLALAYTYRGASRYNLGDYRGAIADYDKAIQLNPDDAEAYNNRGVSRSNLGDDRGAIADYEKAIQLNPDYAKAYYNRGNSHYNLGDFRGAIADYEKAIQLNPDYAAAYYNRGLARYNLGDDRGAIADYEKAIQLNPDYAEAYVGRGNSRYNLGDYRGAIADYEKAIQLNPDYAESYYNRGNSRYNLGDYRGAIADYEKSIQLNPKQEVSYINIGLIQYESGNIQAASQYWQKAIQINAQRAESKLAMAIAQYIQGNRAQGIALASEALSFDASFANPQVLQKNLWGSQLIKDAQKLLQEPEIQRLRSAHKSNIKRHY